MQGEQAYTKFKAPIETGLQTNNNLCKVVMRILYLCKENKQQCIMQWTLANQTGGFTHNVIR